MDVRQNIKNKKYDGTVAKPTYPTIPGSFAMGALYTDVHLLLHDQYQAQMDKFHQDRTAVYEILRSDLEEQFNTMDHPKSKDIWDFAFEDVKTLEQLVDKYERIAKLVL